MAALPRLAQAGCLVSMRWPGTWPQAEEEGQVFIDAGRTAPRVVAKCGQLRAPEGLSLAGARSLGVPGLSSLPKSGQLVKGLSG